MLCSSHNLAHERQHATAFKVAVSVSTNWLIQTHEVRIRQGFGRQEAVQPSYWQLSGFCCLGLRIRVIAAGTQLHAMSNETS